MYTCLIFNQKKLLDSHREMLSDALPEVGLSYFDMEAAPEQYAKADFIIGNPPADMLKHCKKLKLLQLMSAGTDGYLNKIPENAALANATGGYGLAISEHMLAVTLSLMKKLHLYEQNQRECRWRDEGNVTSIFGSTALIIGLGDIGGEFAKRLHLLGAYTIGVRRAGNDKPDYLDELHQSGQIDELLPRADIVALCLPGTAQTNNILDKKRIGAMKKNAILINVGRGSAVDQDALCDALTSGRLAGASVDVTTPEPLPAEHPMWKTPNLIITPHVSGGAHLVETTNRILKIAVQNIKAVIDGSPLKNEIDFSTGYRKL